MKTVDVGSVLDDGQWGGYQKLLVFATALIIVLDGLDNQVFGGVIPVLMKDWSLPRTAFTPVLTSGMVGMMIGGAIGGMVGDKMGRRVALLGSILWFGLLTLLLPMSTTPTMLIVLRFLAGLGLGGATSAIRRDPDDHVHPLRRIAGRLRRRGSAATLGLARAVLPLRHRAARARRRAAKGAAGIAALPRPPAGALERTHRPVAPARTQRA
jgi:MFS family permease